MFVVVVVRFCRSSLLAFLILAYLNNLMHHFLLHWVICFGDFLFVHTPFFFLKYLNFWVFLCSSFGIQSSQNCGWAGSEPYVRSHITKSPCSVIFLNANLTLSCKLSCGERKYFSLYSCLKLSNNDKWLREQNRGFIQLNSWNYQPCITSAFVFGFGSFLIYLICFVSWTCCLFFEAGDIKLLAYN